MLLCTLNISFFIPTSFYFLTSATYCWYMETQLLSTKFDVWVKYLKTSGMETCVNIPPPKYKNDPVSAPVFSAAAVRWGKMRLFQLMWGDDILIIYALLLHCLSNIKKDTSFYYLSPGSVYHKGTETHHIYSWNNGSYFMSSSPLSGL